MGWLPHIFGVQPWTRPMSRGASAAVMCVAFVVDSDICILILSCCKYIVTGQGKNKIADVIQFAYPLTLKKGDYILDLPGTTSVIRRNVKDGGRRVKVSLLCCEKDSGNHCWL